MNKRKRWFLGSCILAVCAIALSLKTLEGNSVYFYTTEEAIADAAQLSKEEIRVGGMVKADSLSHNLKTHSITFTLTNMKGDDIEVFFTGARPDMFKPGSGAVVEGKISQDGSSFVAAKLMVKHSEEYKSPDGAPHSMDKELLQKSMFGAEANG